MKTLLMLSAFIGFTLSEKLDRTYLPPPGSKISGGSPGAIDVPLEFPKETYYSSSQDDNFGQPEIAIGIDRVGSNISPEKYGDITSTAPSFHENFYGFPTTSTSYAFSQTTSYLPAVISTITPDILINSKYPINNFNNISTPGNLGEKNLSFDNAGPSNAYNTVEGKPMLKDIHNVINNQISDNRINSQADKKISDETLRSENGDVYGIPKINSHSADIGIPGITPTPTEIYNSLLPNNFDTFHSPPPSEPLSHDDVNLISSTPVPSDNVYSKTPSKHVSINPIKITNTPYSYRTRPESLQTQDRDAVILNYDNTITPDGYAYSFDTSNGIHADEKGIAINGVQAVGSYSYIGDDGQLYSVNYTADENGFRPYGAHLPTAPPIPDAILKVIEQAAADKANGIYDDGSYDEKKYGYQKYNPTKNNRLNKHNKDGEGTNLNIGKSNNQIPHPIRLGEHLNEDNDTDKENKQIVITKNNLQPFTKDKFVKESVTELSPNYKSEHFGNIVKGHIDSSNNVYNNKLQNKILNSLPHLKNIEKNGTEFYDESGYHYPKPQNDYTLEAGEKIMNRFSETPDSIEIPAMSKKIVENVPIRPFMTPYVSRNDEIVVEHEGDDQSVDIPSKYPKEHNVVLNNPSTNPFPALAKISPYDGQGYLYGNNVNSNNDSPYVTSTEIGLSDITSTLPTAFPSRFNSVESNKDNDSRNPSKYLESTSFENEPPFPNPLLDEEKYRGPLTHSNKLDNYGNINNDDITDPASRYNAPNMFRDDKDYFLEHPIAKTYSEDFSGPKQAQKYDPFTGYHY